MIDHEQYLSFLLFSNLTLIQNNAQPLHVYCYAKLLVMSTKQQLMHGQLLTLQNQQSICYGYPTAAQMCPEKLEHGITHKKYCSPRAMLGCQQFALRESLIVTYVESLLLMSLMRTIAHEFITHACLPQVLSQTKERSMDVLLPFLLYSKQEQ